MVQLNLNSSSIFKTLAQNLELSESKGLVLELLQEYIFLMEHGPYIGEGHCVRGGQAKSEFVGMDSISFWLLVLGAPLVVVVLNALIRALAGLPQSASADIALALIIFDVAVLIQHDEFKAYIPHKQLQELMTAIYAVMIIIGLFLWALSVFVAERKISEYHAYKNRCDIQGCKLGNVSVGFPILGYFLSMFIPVIQILANVGPFTIR